MSNIKSFAVIGGDQRQLYCAKSAARDGYVVHICCFENYDDAVKAECEDISSALDKSDAVILPLPVSKDGENLFSPYSCLPVNVSSLFSEIGGEKPVFCGLKGKTPSELFKGINCYYYGTRDDFAAANAVPTAEGAIEIAMKSSPVTINGSRCLVVGYGRIGRVLSHFLCGLGADVTVSARKSSDLEFIRAAGMKAVRTNSLSGSYDFIFNTVPALVLSREALASCAAGAVIIDLASAPGGVDRNAAAMMSVPVYHALSLPGKTAPEKAGIIIKNAVYNIIGEERI